MNNENNIGMKTVVKNIFESNEDYTDRRFGVRFPMMKSRAR